MTLKQSKSPDISESVVFDLTGRGSQYYDPNTYAIDCAIGGLPFLFGIKDDSPYIRSTARWKYERVDQAREPGEQTLDSGLWVRSQTSFHLGEGIQFQEALEGNVDQLRFRYESGVGIDPWTPGQISLLHSTSKLYPAASNLSGGVLALPATISGTDYVLAVDKTASTSAVRISSVTSGGSSTTLATGATLSEAIFAADSDGSRIYVVTATGIYDLDFTAGSPTVHKHINFDSANASSATIAYVKNRLMLGISFASGSTVAAIYEIATSSHASTVNLSTLTPITASTVVPTGWVWSDIAEGRGAIYVSGYSGDRSSIFKIEPESTGVLGALISVADIPRGEVVYSLYGYLGTFLAIGTSRGVRIAAIADDATIVYGPIIFETTNPVRAFTARDSYVWAAVTAGVGGASGTYRINLGTLMDDGAYPYASDVYAASTTGIVESLGFFPSTGQLFMSVNGSGVWSESLTNLVPEGVANMATVNWGTLEKKAWKRVRVETDTLEGDIEIYADSATGRSQIATLTEGNTYNTDFDLSTAYASPEVNGRVVFSLYRNDTDATKGAALKGYAIKAIPSPTRSRLIQLPLMCYDFETDRRGTRMGVLGGAKYRLAALEAIESAGSTVLVQDFTSGENFDAVIEEIQFSRTTPPSGAVDDNFGGMITITIRTVV